MTFDEATVSCCLSITNTFRAFLSKEMATSNFPFKLKFYLNFSKNIAISFEVSKLVRSLNTEDIKFRLRPANTVGVITMLLALDWDTHKN